jgi:hypothetical protein
MAAACPHCGHPMRPDLQYKIAKFIVYGAKGIMFLVGALAVLLFVLATGYRGR